MNQFHDLELTPLRNDMAHKYNYEIDSNKGGIIKMKEQLAALQTEALEKVSNIQTIKELQEINVAYLGRKGSLTSVLRGMGKLSPEERPVVGELANKVRA